MYKDNMKKSDSMLPMGHQKMNNSEFEVMQNHNASHEKMDNKTQDMQQEVVNLMEELAKLDVSYKGMLAREARYLSNIASLKQEIESLDAGLKPHRDLEKMQVNYEGMLAREERYLKEIADLKATIEYQKEGLYKTYSYRLGYLLIHSTKSFSNFIKLPSRLFGLYQDNKSRKKVKYDARKNTIKSSKDNKPLFKQSLQDSNASKEVKIATIMDEFTSLCFAPEANTLQITPDNFKQELADFQPDMLFIESAWQGKDGSWKLKVSQQAEELIALIEYCREKGIKTMFWNKEDPVHFGTFIEVAKLVDVVFTTDIDCIKKYKEAVQHNDVYLLPFAAQPKTHNPIELYQREDKFNFAGSYYLKYPVRQRDFAVLSDVAMKVRGLDIYDRNFNNDHPHYQFPAQYQSMILGSLPPEEIDKAYKGYEFGINMNTIKQSQTMFARRVFEMLASNTIVLSNYSKGVRLLFGDLVVCSDNANELQRQLDNILVDDITRKKFKLQGLRSVLKQHTYEHRLNYILDKLKIKRDLSLQQDKVIVIAKCETEKDATRVIAQFNQQTITNKVLYILTNNTLIITDHNVHCFRDAESLIVALNDISATHVAVFREHDYYGPHYLEDMQLSHSYLKYHGKTIVTKDYYYEQKKDLEKKDGKEYCFVEQYSTVRSLFPIDSFNMLLQKYPLIAILQEKTVKEKAFSIDSFSYLKNGKSANAENCALIGSELTIDSGVSLINHLLPIAEAINLQKLEAPTNKVLLLDRDIAEETLRKEIKLLVKNNTFNIVSELPDNLHRLITVSEPLYIKDWNRVTLDVEMRSIGDVLFVFEFLDSEQQQISHISHPSAKGLTLEIPRETVYGRVHVRVKGEATVSIGSAVNLQLENIVTTITNDTYDDSDIVIFNKYEINAQLVRPKSKQISIKHSSNSLEITSTLAEDKHAYIYFKETFKREDVNLLLNSVFETKGDVVDFDLRTVFLFLDKNKNKLAHSIIRVDNFSHAMAIPEACEYVRIGFKVTGSGKVNLHSLKIGELREKVNNFIGKSDTLVLAKQYPAYDDLYKYGFLHSRLRAYKAQGTTVDMFRFASKSKADFREFESIDVFQGDKAELKEALSSGQFKRVFIHLIDQAMWDVVKEYKDRVQIYIWIHGAEIQTWQRRSFEFERMTKDQITRQKRLSARRVSFWQNLLDKELNKNVHFIFVSQYLRDESEEGLMRIFPIDQTHIIHNYVDENIFPYTPKDIKQRYNLLTIRPFAGKKYANDVTVNAIISLSKTADFSKYKIEICGDGELFDETVAPLKQFDNVIINKGFLSHAEMAKKYSEYGVFINPTRWDSQGVSRDEARIAGLVSVSSRVTAIPEFVSDEDGIMVGMEDYEALANEIIKMAENPETYSKISKNGHNRVIQQCGLKQTIFKELEFIHDRY